MPGRTGQQLQSESETQMTEIITAAAAADLVEALPAVAREVARLVRDIDRSEVEGLRKARLLLAYRESRGLPVRIARAKVDLLAYAIEREHLRVLAWVAPDSTGSRHVTRAFAAGACPGWPA